MPSVRFVDLNTRFNALIKRYSSDFKGMFLWDFKFYEVHFLVPCSDGLAQPSL